MEPRTNTTERHILDAAERLFTERGFSAVSTTDIAREAGCNQALVHYYFRTKENLFQKVFVGKLHVLLERLQAPLACEEDIFAIVRHIVDTYFDILVDSPQMPVFFLNELVLNKERARLLNDTMQRDLLRNEFYARYQAALLKAADEGIIRRVDPMHFYIDILSLVVFSHLARPLASGSGQGIPTSENDFLQTRRHEVLTLLTEGLKKTSPAQ